MAVNLTTLDQILIGLRKRYPAWSIWYVPSSSGPATWCARPEPLLNASSAEQLAEMIDQAEQKP